MFSFEEYISAWLVYMVCAIGLLVVFWQITKKIPWYYPKQCLRLIVASLLLTPSLVEETTVFWSPAWIRGLLHLIFSGPEGFYPVARILMIGLVGTLLVFAVLSLIVMVVKKTKTQS